MNYIKEFQKNNNLLTDGVVGPITLLKMKDVFNLPSYEATAHFIGQIHHETAGFKYDKENLNYSVKGLLKVFKKYFPTQKLALKYAKNPKKIANRVYANRMGNSNEVSGDGWKYAGKGSLQLTGKNNYRAFGIFINDSSILSNPNNILPKHYWNVAIFFFMKNNLFNLTKTVDYNSVRKLTRKINGGYNGLQHRYDMTMKYYNMLNKKRDEENQHKRKNNVTTNNNVSSDNRDPLVSKKLSTKERVSGTTRNEETDNIKRFTRKSNQWLLP